jgi:4-amino-4-deoxy-L-arabinose transferase-like glycosyltransferase
MNATPGEKGGDFSSSRAFPWAWLAVLTVLGAWLRVIGIGKGLWWDEIYSLMISVRHPFAEIVTVFPGDTQHPLYSLLARLSILAFGEHVWSQRLPAVVFGVASIPALYLLAASVTTRAEALLSAAFLAVSYHHVWFSQNARGYSALAFWTVLSTFFLLRGIRTGRLGPCIGYALAASLGAYTHLTMMFLVASHLLTCTGMALNGWRKGADPGQSLKFALRAFPMAGALTLAFYAPVLGQVRHFFLHHPSGMRSVSTPRWAVWETLRGLTLGLGVEGVLVGAALVAACGAWSYFKQSRVVFALFALPGLVTLLGAFLARGTMYPRFYFFLIGLAIVILVRGLMVTPRWVLARLPGSSARANPRLAQALSAAFAAVFFASSAFSLVRNYKYPKQDFEAAIRFVDAEREAGEPVVTAGASTFPLLQYYGKPWESVETVDQLRAICSRGEAVWVVYTFPRYLESWSPPLADMIRREFAIARVFPGTVGDGDVFVAKSQSH